MTTGGQRRLAFLALVAGATGIAFAPIFVRLSDVGPCAVAFYRILLSLPLLWLWLMMERRTAKTPPPTTRKEFLLLALAGFFFAGDLAFWHGSIQLTTVANATLFANFAPIFVTIGARTLFLEEIGSRFLIGMGLALGGAILLVGASFQLTSGRALGDFLGLITALFYGSYMLSVKQLRRRFSVATVLAWSGLTSALALLIAAMALREEIWPKTTNGWWVLVGLALVSQVAGQGLIAYAFAHLSASFGSLSLLLQPVIAALLAWSLLGEHLGKSQLLGGSVILAGIALASRQTRSETREAPNRTQE